MANALLLLAKGKKGLGGSEPDGDEPEADDSGDDIPVSKEELGAIKAFDRASTPEERAKALKAFIKLCEGY